MGTTQPIKSKEDLKKFMDYYKAVRPNPRNYALVILGLHTALRISDILELHWKDVYGQIQKARNRIGKKDKQKKSSRFKFSRQRSVKKA